MESVLPPFFQSKMEMCQSISHLASKYCTKCKIYQSGNNYYKIGCYDPECTFRITYSHRSSNYKEGFYLIEKSTFIFHKSGCNYDPNNLMLSDDAKIQAEKVLFLFNEKIPSTSNIRDVLYGLGYKDLTNNRIQYIKTLCKESIYHGAKDTFSQIFQYCESLKKHGWIIEYEFFQGFLSTITVFPPWAHLLVSYYCNPTIVDCTFSKQKLRYHTGTIIDGEKKIHPFGLVIRPTEDSYGYKKLFEFVKLHAKVECITIISDMAKCINKAAKNIFDNKYHWMWCLYHFIENINKKFKFKPSYDLWLLFKRACSGEIPESDVFHIFLDKESECNIECKTTEKAFNYHLIPSFSLCCKRRLCFASSPEESLNSALKKNGNDSLTMLKQFVLCSKRWYEELISRNYNPNSILTNFAENYMKNLIVSTIENDYDQSFHFPVLKNGHISCFCTFYQDSGFPCYGIIKGVIEKKENPFMYCDKTWTVKHFKQLLEDSNIVASSPCEPSALLVKQEDLVDNIFPKLKYLYDNNIQYRNKLQAILNEAEGNFVIPPISVINNAKSRESKRKLSFGELSKKRMLNWKEGLTLC